MDYYLIFHSRPFSNNIQRTNEQHSMMFSLKFLKFPVNIIRTVVSSEIAKLLWPTPDTSIWPTSCEIMALGWSAPVCQIWTTNKQQNGHISANIKPNKPKHGPDLGHTSDLAYIPYLYPAHISCDMMA